MKKTLVLTAIVLCVCILAGCSDKAINPASVSGYPESNSDQTGSKQSIVQQLGTTGSSAPAEESTPEIPKRAAINLPNPKWADNITGEIVNTAGIEYEYTDDCLYFDADEDVIFTFEAFSAEGVRLNYECRYPGDLARNEQNLSRTSYEGTEVLKWFVYFDTVSNGMDNEMRLMVWERVNSYSDVVGLLKFMRASGETSFRPIVLPYERNRRISAAGVPGMDRVGSYGDAVQHAMWNEVSDISSIMTEVIEITVAENYMPDENGIRFVCIGHPRVTSDPADVLIICDVPTLTVSYSKGTKTLTAINGVIYATIGFTVDEHLSDKIILNDKEYPRLFFGEYKRNITVVIDEQFGQPVFGSKTLRDYEIVIAEIER